jgi:hypothetical protein
VASRTRPIDQKQRKKNGRIPPANQIEHLPASILKLGRICLNWVDLARDQFQSNSPRNQQNSDLVLKFEFGLSEFGEKFAILPTS